MAPPSRISSEGGAPESVVNTSDICCEMLDPGFDHEVNNMWKAAERRHGRLVVV